MLCQFKPQARFVIKYFIIFYHIEIITNKDYIFMKKISAIFLTFLLIFLNPAPFIRANADIMDEYTYNEHGNPPKPKHDAPYSLQVLKESPSDLELTGAGVLYTHAINAYSDEGK